MQRSEYEKYLIFAISNGGVLDVQTSPVNCQDLFYNFLTTMFQIQCKLDEFFFRF